MPTLTASSDFISLWHAQPFRSFRVQGGNETCEIRDPRQIVISASQ